MKWIIGIIILIIIVIIVIAKNVPPRLVTAEEKAECDKLAAKAKKAGKDAEAAAKKITDSKMKEIAATAIKAANDAIEYNTNIKEGDEYRSWAIDGLKKHTKKAVEYAELVANPSSPNSRIYMLTNTLNEMIGTDEIANRMVYFHLAMLKLVSGAYEEGLNLMYKSSKVPDEAIRLYGTDYSYFLPAYGAIKNIQIDPPPGMKPNKDGAMLTAVRMNGPSAFDIQGFPWVLPESYPVSEEELRGVINMAEEAVKFIRNRKSA